MTTINEDFRSCVTFDDFSKFVFFLEILHWYSSNLLSYIRQMSLSKKYLVLTQSKIFHPHFTFRMIPIGYHQTREWAISWVPWRWVSPPVVSDHSSIDNLAAKCASELCPLNISCAASPSKIIWLRSWSYYRMAKFKSAESH